MCPEENAHHQGRNMEAYQESREVWPSCQLLTFSVSAYICFPVIGLCLYLSFSLLFFLTHIQDTDTVRDIFSQGRLSWAFFGPGSMNWSILGIFWNKQNFTNLQLVKIKKHFTIALLSEPCLWIWKAGASCCLLHFLHVKPHGVSCYSLVHLFSFKVMHTLSNLCKYVFSHRQQRNAVEGEHSLIDFFHNLIIEASI